MPVDPRAVMASPPASTQPAGLAVKAVAEQADPGPYLRRLREAIFVERRTPDRGDALLELARDTTPELDLDRLRIAFGSHGPVEALGADLERARGRSLPTLEVGATAVDGRAGYDAWRAAVIAGGAEPVENGRLDVEGMLRRFGPATTAEVAAVCDLPGPRRSRRAVAPRAGVARAPGTRARRPVVASRLKAGMSGGGHASSLSGGRRRR